ncbi:MAG: hypothetical protein M3376_01235 [Actinomycetota bacterium]|nr:hypothetical protein [Actinomycetota bacterium]
MFGAVAILALIAGCWLVLLAPKRTQIGTVQAQTAQAQARTAAANATVASATQARADAEEDSKLLVRLVRAVPEDDDVGPLVRQLDSIARANKIDFRAAKLVSSAAAAPTAPAPPAATGEKGKAAAPAAAAVTQPPPGTVVGEAGLLTVPFSFTFDGGYTEMERFLAAIHGLAKSNGGKIRVRGRLITIDGFSLGAGRAGFPKVTALVSATAYLLPGASPVPAATTALPTPVAAPVAK